MAREGARPHSKVPGYKPIRLVTGHGTVNATIVEITGFVRGTFGGQPGQEPLHPVQILFDKGFGPGDSGCLALDREIEPYGAPPPYLIYQGVENLGSGGVLGYGALIEQANRLWDFECYLDANP